jgi:TATA-binding protein-associated factor Taf7
MFSKMMNKAGKMLGLSKSAMKMLLLAIVLVFVAYGMRHYYKKSREGMDDEIDTSELDELLTSAADGLEETMIEDKESKDDKEDDDEEEEEEEEEEEVDSEDPLNIETFANYSLIEGLENKKIKKMKKMKKSKA